MKPDLFTSPDYFHLDELLTEEHRLIRDTSREWVKKEVSPIIEEACQKAKFPDQVLTGLAEIGAFGPYIPAVSIALLISDSVVLVPACIAS